VYLVRSGAVKLVCTDRHGRQTIVGLRWPGSFLGVESVMARLPNAASTVTLIPSTMEQITREDFLQKIQSDFNLARRVLQFHSWEIRNYSARSTVGTAERCQEISRG
jgi:CRP-like cAMP-binding protein